MRKGRVLLAVAGVVAAATGASAADKIGTVSQSLVAGTEVSAQEQQEQGLVIVDSPAGACSGVLLNGEWVISAAHCFTDPTVKSYQVQVVANWPKQQTREGVELHLLENDIALVRVHAAFEGVGPDYNLPVFTGTLAPGRALKVYGSGIYALASGKGGSAQPSMADDKYRSGDFQVSRIDATRFWFGGGKGGAIPAGGDSGGPAFINAGGQTFLAGISSKCTIDIVEGKPKIQDDWTWVNRVHECGYAEVGLVWPQIQRHIGTNGCRKYAWRAVGAVEMAKDTYGCDEKAISGPRWSPYFDVHLDWCMSVKAADANAEDKARTAEMHACRIAAAMPKGTGALAVEESAVGFKLSGGGYPVNSRIIVRVTGAAAKEQNITSNFSNQHGVFFVELSAANVCATAGPITFTAEDQDRPPSPPVTMTCPAGGGETGEAVAVADPAAEPAPEQVQPAPQPAKVRLKNVVAVALDVDLYDAPGGGGQVIGMLGAGTRGVRLLGPCADDWCNVRWPDGQGWVYSGPGYQSLELP